jgi:hypothetical protein
MVLANADGQHAKFGQLLPDVAAPAGCRVADGEPAFEAVVPGDVAPYRVGQRALVVVEVEIHAPGLIVP